MDCSKSAFPVLHYLPAFAQTHVHWVGDAIQPSHLIISLPEGNRLEADHPLGTVLTLYSFYGAEYN